MKELSMKMALVVGAGAVLWASASLGAAQNPNSSAANCPDEMAFLQDQKKKAISREERQKVRIKVFDELDANKDGVVAREEYVRCLVETPAFKKSDKGAVPK